MFHLPTEVLQRIIVLVVRNVADRVQAVTVICAISRRFREIAIDTRELWVGIEYERGLKFMDMVHERSRPLRIVLVVPDDEYPRGIPERWEEMAVHAAQKLGWAKQVIFRYQESARGSVPHLNWEQPFPDLQSLELWCDHQSDAPHFDQNAFPNGSPRNLHSVIISGCRVPFTLPILHAPRLLHLSLKRCSFHGVGSVYTLLAALEQVQSLQTLELVIDPARHPLSTEDDRPEGIRLPKLESFVLGAPLQLAVWVAQCVHISDRCSFRPTVRVPPSADMPTADLCHQTDTAFRHRAFQLLSETTGNILSIAFHVSKPGSMFKTALELSPKIETKLSQPVDAAAIEQALEDILSRPQPSEEARTSAFLSFDHNPEDQTPLTHMIDTWPAFRGLSLIMYALVQEEAGSQSADSSGVVLRQEMWQKLLSRSPLLGSIWAKGEAKALIDGLAMLSQGDFPQKLTCIWMQELDLSLRDIARLVGSFRQEAGGVASRSIDVSDCNVQGLSHVSFHLRVPCPRESSEVAGGLVGDQRWKDFVTHHREDIDRDFPGLK